MHLIFEDDDARILRSVHHERVPAVQDGAVAISGIERHQRVTPYNLRWKAGEDISIFEHRVVGDRLEVVVAIDRDMAPAIEALSPFSLAQSHHRSFSLVETVRPPFHAPRQIRGG